MDKIVKRFVALLVVFASIVSFLPIKFGENGRAANAAATSSPITVTGLSQSGEKVDSSKAPTYSTQNQFLNFEVTVEDLYKDPQTLKIGETAVVKQELVITQINRMNITNGSNDYLTSVGTTIEDINRVGGRVGKRIVGLPLGVNEIVYYVKTTTVSKIQDPSNSNDTAGILTEETTTQESPAIIKIEHANSYVQSQVKYVDFTSYVGGRTDSDPTNNTKPFKYTSRLYSEEGKALSFNYEVPNSVTDLDYNIYFPNGVDTNNQASPDLVFVNGAKGTGITSSGNELKGTLQKTANSTLLVIAIKHPGALQNTYAIEINYSDKKADDDYSLTSAGITKYNYNDDSSVKAYIGKEFTLSETMTDVPTYEGTLYVDKKATMINLDPVIARNKSKTAYEVKNYYIDSNGVAKIKESELKNNKAYIDFAAGKTSNTIYLEIYEGENGNKTGALLGRYVLNVNFLNNGNDAFNMDLAFSNSDDTSDGVYLAQRGTPNVIDPFKISKRSYDLHSNNPVKITLNGRTSSNEYLKVWVGQNEYSDSVTEAQESIDNSFNNVDGTRASSLTIDLKKYQKIIVQAYYDEVKENDDHTKSLVEAHSLGDKYVFYIYGNLTSGSDGGNSGNEKSNDAYLSSLKFDNGTLKDSSGSTGFESEVYDYTVTVPKDDTSTTITAIANNSNASSITATIQESKSEYELTSGEGMELPLNDTGKTTFKIVVIAQDGTTTKTYNVVVKNDTRSAVATLKNVYFSPGDYNFNPKNSTTKVRVDEKITSIKVTPVADDSKAKITVDGTKYTGSSISVSLRGSQETDFEIKVTSEDGTESNTYSFEVIRSNSDLSDDDEDDESDVFYNDTDDVWVDTSKYEEWGKINGKEIYFDNKGRQVKNSWVTKDGQLYYLGSNGYKVTGWRTESDGKKYYLDPSTGAIKKGWLYQNNNWYYLGANGVMKTGWLNLGSNWYYFTPDGKMVVNQSMYIDGKTYNFAQDGSIY